MRIGIAGCAGRMGRMLAREIAATAGCTLAGGSARPGASVIGTDLGSLAGLEPLGVAVLDDAATLFAGVDAVLDFTTPEATERHATLAATAGAIHVVGTTGLGPSAREALDQAARRVPVVVAPNMSVGVNLLMALVEQVARTLGPDFDIEIVEMHHRHKVDAPSGTALGLAEAAATGRGVRLTEVVERARDGLTGPRRRGAIGLAALRGGDVVGDHAVLFAGEGERIELTHRASSREIYAKGAVRAARWAEGRPPGLYTMRDVLGLG
jgi:4-hydroxy-tetrahydrodipicolinate reductase